MLPENGSLESLCQKCFRCSRALKRRLARPNATACPRPSPSHPKAPLPEHVHKVPAAFGSSTFLVGKSRLGRGATSGNSPAHGAAWRHPARSCILKTAQNRSSIIRTAPNAPIGSGSNGSGVFTAGRLVSMRYWFVRRRPAVVTGLSGATAFRAAAASAPSLRARLRLNSPPRQVPCRTLPSPWLDGSRPVRESSLRLLSSGRGWSSGLCLRTIRSGCPPR